MSDTFLEQPIRQVIQRCVEHGLWTALWSTAKHLQRIDKTRKNSMNKVEHIEPLVNETQYEFWILIVGLVIATIVFGVEFLVGKCVKYDFF